LLDDLRKGLVVPFVGAGFSKNARLPAGASMPDWVALGKEIAKGIHDFDFSGPLDAISAFEHEFTRSKLVEEISRLLLVNQAQPGAAHHAFCQLPFDLVCTTNFDFLLERGYEASHKYCRPVLEEDQLSIRVDEMGVTLLKYHGDLHHPRRMVVTEGDYDSFIDFNPLIATYLGSILISRTAFFVGYSLEDPDFRQIWKMVRERLGNLRRPAYTVMIGANAQTVSRFDRRGVKVINLPGKGSDYPRVLAEVFSEMERYWLKGELSTSTTSTPRSTNELKLPIDSSKRLCFFAVPVEQLSFYRLAVFPIIESIGLTPVTAADVLSPNQSILAKISALIETAEIFVADASTQGVITEIGMAIGRKDLDRILLVCTSSTILPSEYRSFPIIVRPEYPVPDDPALREFLSRLREWMESVADSIRPGLFEEPRRLLEAEEYRPAVVSAMTLLESEIRPRVDSPSQYISGSRLFELARQQEIIDIAQAKQVRTWNRLRNTAVHTGTGIGLRRATTVVEGVYSLLASLK